MIQETLKLISIQHELGMAIGLDLRLKPMLKEFIQVALKRLALSGVDFYFDSNIIEKTNTLVQADCPLTHLLSVPNKSLSLDENKASFLNEIYIGLQNQQSYHKEYNEQASTYAYYFNLTDIGLICLHRKARPLEHAYLALLFPIFKRLAISCQGSLEHEQLLLAIETRKEAESTITYQLLHDDLTRLPNRRMLMEVLKQDLLHAKQNHHLGALLFIDLDRFKAINDSLGHEVGDDLLKAVANILLQSVHRTDLVARLSGDEFVLVLKNIEMSEQISRKRVEEVLKNIYEVFVQPIHAGEHLLHISPSIGIEYYPLENTKPERILRNADTAMYIAKAQGKYSAVYYEEYMSIDIERRLEIEKLLQQAVKTYEQFKLEYQPQYNNDGECIGAEALTRWRLPDASFVSPKLFIPLAEETGLILALGDWVIKTACEDIYALEQTTLPDSFQNISVNVSAVQFNQEQFLPNLFEHVKQSKIQAKHLCLELTESALISNVSSMREKIAQLQLWGIEVSVDDFGTGYSSLSYLNRFPIATLKIDQAFVRNMHTDKNNCAIVKTIIALAQSLSLAVIAEGVETREELLSLQKVGCKCYQGFYFNSSYKFQSLVKAINASPLYESSRCKLNSSVH